MLRWLRNKIDALCDLYHVFVYLMQDDKATQIVFVEYTVIYFSKTGELEDCIIEAISKVDAEQKFIEKYKLEVFEVYKSTK